MGLGYVLSEELHFQGGRILDLNFDSYEIPRFSWLPKIETVLIDNPGLAAQGGGEPPIVNMGAVVANAVFDAVGARLTRLPLTPERVKAELPESLTR
jgi:CO/xanthine dehydrogenase Mo-binding subunit